MHCASHDYLIQSYKELPDRQVHFNQYLASSTRKISRRCQDLMRDRAITPCQKHSRSELFSISTNDRSFCIASQRRVQYHFRVCVNILKCLISVISVSRHVIAVFFFSFLPPGAALEYVACICSVQKLVIASDEAV